MQKIFEENVYVYFMGKIGLQKIANILEYSKHFEANHIFGCLQIVDSRGRVGGLHIHN